MLSTPTRKRRTGAVSAVTGVFVGGLVGAVIAVTGTVIPVSSASAASSSAVTITAAAYDADAANSPMPDLAVTVSQTRDLVSQGISLSWTGGLKSTVPAAQTGGENFLQIAQCWGDDPDDATQPDRTTCQYGAMLTAGARRDGPRTDGTVAPEDEDYTAPGADFVTPTYTSIPFRAVTGEVVESVVDHVKKPVDVNTNQFFTLNTSNEITWAGSASDGTGAAKFEVQTALQAPGLGCGTPVTAADGTVSGQSCWLVIIPRGTNDIGEQAITKSGLFWDSWKHHIAVKLDFKPLGVRCALGSAERQVSGSELIAGAVASWQPELCNAAGGSIYTILTGSESDAAVAANSVADAPLALTSRPLATGGATDALRYAPIALTGLSISFSIDRAPSASGGVPQEELDKERTAFTSLNLTPRLVAKLLTNSYLDSLPTGADRSHVNYLSPASPGKNPRTITYDPDFLEINDPEWANQAIVGASVADMLLPQGRSDAAWALWSYVMADPDAVAFLNGTPDPWGMIVNPWSSTNASVNPGGVGMTLPREDFPKSDPIEQAASSTQGSINLVTWRPYTTDLDTGGYYTLRGDGQLLGGWDPASVPPKFTKTPRAVLGVQRVIGLTDTASAAKYQVVSASLRNPAGQFVAPTTASLTAAAAAMTASPTQSQVYSFDPTSSAARGATTAYPLAMPVYAATNPSIGQAAVRASYASFIRYAATTGQVAGAGSGQLPEGYAPIPDGWRLQALSAADAILAGSSAPTSSSGSQSYGYGDSSGSDLATGPQSTGDLAGSLLGSKTPNDPESGALASAVPLGLLSGLIAAAAVPLISRPRRSL